MRRTIPITHAFWPQRSIATSIESRISVATLIGACRRNPEALTSFISQVPPGVPNTASRRRMLSARVSGRAPRRASGSARERPKTARSIVLAYVRCPSWSVTDNGSGTSLRRNPEMLSKPMIASTAPLAGTRSPRRAIGRDSGSIRLASLTNSSSCSLCCGVRRDRGSLRTACSNVARFSSSNACIGSVSTNSTRPSSGASVRRRSPALPARSTKKVVGARGATVRCNGWHHSSSCEASHSICRVVRLPGSASWSISTSRYRCSIVVGPPAGPSRSGWRSTWIENARANSVFSSAHLAGGHRSYRNRRILASSPRWPICRASSSGSSACHLSCRSGSLISRAKAA